MTREGKVTPDDTAEILLDTLDEQELEIKRLRLALKPFSRLADEYDKKPNDLPDLCPVRASPLSRDERICTVGDLRHARAALKGEAG